MKIKNLQVFKNVAKTLKIAFVINFVLLLTVGLSACGKNGQNESGSSEKISCGLKITTPDGAPLISAAALKASDPNCFDVELVANLDQLSAQVQKGESDFAIVPLNLAAKIFNSTQSYRVVGTVTSNLNYVFAKKNSELPSTVSETKLDFIKNNESILAFGENGLPGISLKTELNSVNVAPKVTYLTDGQTVVQGLLSQDNALSSVNYAILPEPVATAVENNPKLNETWKRICLLGKIDSPQSVLIVKSESADKYDFNEIAAKYQLSTNLGDGELRRGNVDKIVDYATDNFETTMKTNAPIVKKAILNSTLNFTFYPVNEAKMRQNILETLDNLEANSISGMAISGENVSNFFAF